VPTIYTWSGLKHATKPKIQVQEEKAAMEGESGSYLVIMMNIEDDINCSTHFTAWLCDVRITVRSGHSL
jgi:hypothetical protein